ncbi:delta-endotoxin CytB [Ceratobasidium sp. AG-I]|nr:delta-endotoxin CytB [Ceratobasidium sp. AG-I]
MSLNASPQFSVFHDLPENLIPASNEVREFAKSFLDRDSSKFDRSKFKRAVDNYDGDDLIINKYQNSTIHGGTSTVTQLVDKIVAFLQQALGIQVDMTKLAGTMEETLLHLKEASDKGSATFAPTEEPGKTSYSYRLLISFRQGGLPTDFYATVTTITIKADIVEEKEWNSLQKTTKKDFSAAIDGLQLVVGETFKAPTGI